MTLASAQRTAEQASAVLDDVQRAVVGKREGLELVLLGVLAAGHGSADPARTGRSWARIRPRPPRTAADLPRAWRAIQEATSRARRRCAAVTADRHRRRWRRAAAMTGPATLARSSRPGRRSAPALCAALVGGTALVTADVVLGGPLTRLDARMLRAAPGTRWAVPLVARLTEVGSPSFMFPVVGLVCAARAVADRSPRAIMPLGRLLAGALARRTLCGLVRRPRPPAQRWLVTPEGYSYPSKHTVIAALGMATLAECLPVGRGQRIASHLGAGASCMVAASRPYLGVHWPTDAVGGLLFAAAWHRTTTRCWRAARG